MLKLFSSQQIFSELSAPPAIAVNSLCRRQCPPIKSDNLIDGSKLFNHLVFRAFMVTLDTMNVELDQGDAHVAASEQPEDIERKARVDAVWQQMNKGVSEKSLKSILNQRSSNAKKSTQKSSSQNWMTVLNLAPKKTPTIGQCVTVSHPTVTTPDVISDDAKKIAYAALLAVRDAASSATTSGKGKIEVTEIRDFAGEEIEMKRVVEGSSSKEASGKGKGPTSAVDDVLEQIRKKPKLSVLDKTKKDWGEFKEEKGLEEELDAYKKSSNQYLDKVSFLERTDYREFERERDARLALQAKRKPDMREDF